MSGVVPVSTLIGICQLIALHAVWLSMKHTYDMHRNHVSGGAPVRSISVLVIRLTVWYLRSAGF